MKYFLSLLIAVVSFSLGGPLQAATKSSKEVFCPSSIMKIEDVEITDRETRIELDNGLVWVYDDIDLLDGPYGWKIGDQVEIVYVHFSGYYLGNTSYQGCVFVKLANAESEDIKALRIQEINFDSEKKSHYILLDDATTWFIGSWSSQWILDWKEGDRIIVTPQEFVCGKADHYLINLDRKIERDIPGNARAQLMASPEYEKAEELNKRDARSWTIHVASIDKENGFVTLELDNKTKWQTLVRDLDWNVGDELAFSYSEEGIRLYHLIKKQSIQVQILPASIESAKSLYIEKVIKNGKKLILSDESIWFFNGWNTKKKKWKKGDRIILSPCTSINFDTSSHFLINLDTWNEKIGALDSSSATLIH